MTVLCPVCGQATIAKRAPVEALSGAPLTIAERALVELLGGAYPRAMTVEAVMSGMYGHRPDGGPEHGELCIRVYISRLRKKLPAYGWTIPYVGGGRGNIGFYRLAPVEES